MLPVIAIVGRPNVGKSTLFNCLTKSRNALVYDEPGVTRDRQYGYAYLEDQALIIIDTGGLEDSSESKKDSIHQHIHQQVEEALTEAHIIIFIVDGRSGLTTDDEWIAQKLRQSNKPVMVTVNKTDGVNPDTAKADFYALGLGDLYTISASNNNGTRQLLETAYKKVPKESLNTRRPSQNGIKLAIVGRPNVGKSTLVNRLLGEARVIEYDEPGTTRDSIFLPLNRDGQDYIIIDTAGVRKNKRSQNTIEKFSVLKTLQALHEAQVTIMVIDASNGIVKQDLHLLDVIIKTGKALIIALNKWDCLNKAQREALKADWPYQLRFADFATVKTISAKHGTHVGNLFSDVHTAFDNATKDLNTTKLTEVLKQAASEHLPPMIGRRRIKYRYAHQGGKNPLIIVVHGTLVEKTPTDYKKYLINTFRKAFKIKGTPIHIQFKSKTRE